MVQPPEVADVLGRRPLLHLQRDQDNCNISCAVTAVPVVGCAPTLPLTMHACARHCITQPDRPCGTHNVCPCTTAACQEVHMHPGQAGVGGARSHRPEPQAHGVQLVDVVCRVVLQDGRPDGLAVDLERVGQAGCSEEGGWLGGALQIQQRQLQEEAAQTTKKALVSGLVEG